MTTENTFVWHGEHRRDLADEGALGYGFPEMPGYFSYETGLRINRLRGRSRKNCRAKDDRPRDVSVVRIPFGSPTEDWTLLGDGVLSNCDHNRGSLAGWASLRESVGNFYGADCPGLAGFETRAKHHQVALSSLAGLNARMTTSIVH